MIDGLHSLTVNDPAQTPCQGESVANCLQNAACLSCVLSFLVEEKWLIRASAVCKHWKTVLESDAVWQAAYTHVLPQPLEYERLPSYRQSFQRLRGLLKLPPPQQLGKGQAICYNPTTSSLVTYRHWQSLVHVQDAHGKVRSKATATQVESTAEICLLASTGSELVVLAAWDGPLELWDAGRCESAGILGSHKSFVTSLAASGDLVASTCSSQLKLWNVSTRQCLFRAPAFCGPHSGPEAVMGPHVAVCQQQMLLALANSATPGAPSDGHVDATLPNCAAPDIRQKTSVVKVYSILPAGTSTQGSSTNRAVATTGAGLKQHPQQSAVVEFGSSSANKAPGALLLHQLQVDEVADMLMDPGLLLIATCVNEEAVYNYSHNIQRGKPFTVVVQIWDTKTWQMTRLVSPRLFTGARCFDVHGMPLIALTQGMLLCARLRSGSLLWGNRGLARYPRCCIHGWQLPNHLLKATRATSTSSSSSSLPQEFKSNINAYGRMLACLPSVSPNKQGGMLSAGSGSSSGDTAGSSGQVESYCEGAMINGGPAAPRGIDNLPLANHTIMLPIADNDRDHWLFSAEHRWPENSDLVMTVMFTTPNRLVIASGGGL